MADGSTPVDAELASDIADRSLETPAATAKAADALANGTHADEDGEEEEDGDADGDGEGDAAATGDAAAGKKKKRKPKKKKPKAAAADTSSGVEPAAGTEARPVHVNDLPSLLKQLALQQKGKGRDDQPPGEHKFWSTQPVPKYQEPNLLQTTDGESLPEGPILPDQVCRAAAKAEPEKLLDGFDWCLVDVNDDADLDELHDLLYNHYVEDLDGGFRLKYSKKFFEWALKPPGWKEEWHLGVRARPTQEGKKGKLVAFIAGTPVTLKVRDGKFASVEINFLTIHRKLRSKRLAPVLIKEITRRCYRLGIYQALYTAGTLLPTPVSTCRYYHRSLDWEHLYRNGFSHLPAGQTEFKMKFKYRLETSTSIKGLRPMQKKDVPAVMDLLVRYLERYSMRQTWTPEEIDHWLCSEASKDVVWSYVVEVDGKITDFVSYYLLESTVLKNSRQESIRAAYLYYYATESAFQVTSGNKKSAKQLQEAHAARLQLLVHDLLILAKKENFHVFNALTLLDNPLFLREEKFEPGDGRLHYYLFNWRTKLLPGGVDEQNQIDLSKMGGVGVVML